MRDTLEGLKQSVENVSSIVRQTQITKVCITNKLQI